MKRINLSNYLHLVDQSEIIKTSYNFSKGLDFQNFNDLQFYTDLVLFQQILNDFISKEIDSKEIPYYFENLKNNVDGYVKRFSELDKNQRCIHAAILYRQIEIAVINFISDVRTKHIYRITRKDQYNVEILIDSGHKVFSESTQNLFDEQTKFDIDMGLRCLAFELPTAFGFHLFRAVETLMIKLYKKALEREPSENHNWGKVIKEIKESQKVDNVVIEHLTSLKDNHRNPLIHPEQNLEMEEAFELLGLLISVIMRLTKEINA